MEYTILYQNENTIKVKKESFKIVRRYKEELARKVNILLPNMILQYDEIILCNDEYLDDYNINDNDLIIMKIEVKVYEVQNVVSLKCHRFSLDYDAKIRDIKRIYCIESKLDNVLLVRDKACNDNDLLRDGYYYFIAYSEVKVTVFDELGVSCDILVFENEIILYIKDKLFKQFWHNHKPILMINEILLHDEDELLEYKEDNVYFIFSGFCVCVFFNGNILMSHYVNFKTKISHFENVVSKKLNIEPKMIFLMVNSHVLDNNEVVGSYKMTEGCEVKVMMKIQIYILSNINDKAVEHFIRHDQLISHLKKELSELFKVNVDEFKLSIDNKELSNESTVDSLGFIEGARVVMTVDNLEKYVMTRAPIRCEKISVSIINQLACSSDNNVTRIIHIDINISINNLRKEISRQLKIAMCPVDIYLTDRLLESGNIIKYGVKDGDVLTLRTRVRQRNAGEQFILNVVHDSDKIQPFLIGDFETVRHFKLILRNQYNVNVDLIKLFLDGKELSNDDIIRDLDIVSGVKVTLVLNKDEKYVPSLIRLKVKKTFNEGDCDDVRQLSVSDCDTIDRVIEKINVMFGLSSSDYVLSYGGDILNKDMLVSTYSIGDEDELVISHSLLIRYVVGGFDSATRVQTYPFSANDKVSDLKIRIMKKLNIDTKLINLSYSGQWLDSECKLTDYEIINGSCLMMLATLTGG